MFIVIISPHQSLTCFDIRSIITIDKVGVNYDKAALAGIQ